MDATIVSYEDVNESWRVVRSVVGKMLLVNLGFGFGQHMVPHVELVALRAMLNSNSNESLDKV